MKFICITSVFLLIASAAFSQAKITIIEENLIQPVGIEWGPDSTILIAESGTGHDDGGVTLIHPSLGTLKVVDSIPSYFDTVTMEVMGPMRVQMLDDDKAAVFIGEVPGPYGSSILIYDVSDFSLIGGPSLGPQDAIHQIKVGEYVLSQGYEGSNPFSMVHDGCDMYIVDAAANAIVKRNGLTGVLSIFAEFDQVNNPLPFGPPMTDAVPTKIVQDTSGFLVSSLTGFPFADGIANIYHVDMDGNVTVRDSGYTLVTDLIMDPEGDGFYALQFANFDGDSIPPFLNRSALITHTHADGNRDTVVSGFGASPGFLVNQDGTFYVTNIFEGNLAKLEATSTGLFRPDYEILNTISIFPNPVRGGINLKYDLPESGESQIEIYNVLGQRIYTKNLGVQIAGKHNIQLVLPSISSSPGQMYYLLLKSGNNWYQSSFTRVE